MTGEVNKYNRNSTSNRYDVTILLQMVKSLTIATVNQHVISFIRLFFHSVYVSERHLVTNCEFKVWCYQTSPSDVKIKVSGESYPNVISFLKSLWPLHCDMSPSDVTVKSISDSQVTDFWRFYCEVTKTLYDKSPGFFMLSLRELSNKTAKSTVMITLRWNHLNMVN